MVLHVPLRRLLLHNHIDLAVERIARIVVGFSRHKTKEEIAVLAQTAARTRNANAVLPAVSSLASIDCRDQFPATANWIRVGVRLRVETELGAVTGVKQINLQRAGARMPRIGIDLLDFDHAAEIHAHSPTAGSRSEEKV